jgi:nucleoid-associated protein YgaU
MTRENKLSIVIAFGLLIFVGMLVADHFSIASHREVASLGSNVSTPPLISPTTLVDGPPLPSSTTERITPVNTNVHVVAKGETLRSICLNFYGDSGLVDSVSTYNQLYNPNAIEIGNSISLPTRSILIAGNIPTPSNAQVNENSTIVQKMGTYTVKKGDTLSEIAQTVMGTTKKTQLLIEVNKDVMPNPDRIKPGMILQFPLQSS